LFKLPIIIAHRGASAVAPENTLAAFRRALRDGAEGLECDVRLAKDGVPVVFHDATLKRTAFIDEKLSDWTSSNLSKLRVGAWFNEKNQRFANRDYDCETVPTLADFFELTRGSDCSIYVEMKCEDKSLYKLARKTAELIIDFGIEDRVVVKSFALDALIEIKEHFPQIRTAALFKPNPLRVLHPGQRLIKPALRLAADELSLHYSLATAPLMRKAHAAALRTVIWTADHPAWVKRASKLGIHGIITNNPARLLKKRRELAQQL
jgi:glycerophosphoryl diester phosphodiesterase